MRALVVGEGGLEIGWGYLAEGVFGELKYSCFFCCPFVHVNYAVFL